MMDDIDIEEHDLMQNPMLKDIFPDLSIIKKELSEYEESVRNVKVEPPDESSAEVNTFQDRAKPQNDQDNGALLSNVIILGSKPSSITTPVKPQSPKVALQNVSSYLEKSKTYCKVCSILFVNTNSFELHLEQIHTSSNNVESKTIVKKPFLPVKPSNKKYKCELCTVYLSSASNLLRHLRNIHQKKNKEVERKSLDVRKEKSDHVPVETTISTSPIHEDGGHKCFHCEKAFLTSNLLVEHLYSVLDPIGKADATQKNTLDSDSIDKNILQQNNTKPKQAKDNSLNATNKIKPKSPKDPLITTPKIITSKLNNKDNAPEKDDAIPSRPKRMRETVVNNDKVPVQKRDTMISNEDSKKEKRSESLNPVIRINPLKFLEKNIPKEKVIEKPKKAIEKNISKEKVIGKSKKPIEKSISKDKIIDNPKKAIEKNTSKEKVIVKSKKAIVNNISKDKVIERSLKAISKNISKGNVTAKAKKVVEKLILKEKVSEKTKKSAEMAVTIDTVEIKKTGETESRKERVPNSGDDKKVLVEKAFQCPICSHYIITFDKYANHMINKHRMKNVPRLRRVVFDSQCLFCSSKLVNMASYNIHILRSHRDKHFLEYRKVYNSDKSLTENNTIVWATFNPRPFAFKSVLYKCCKCDIHFLTARSAMNHSKHMEILINWKCLICDKIFKKCDKFLHVKQHSCSHAFNVHNVDNTDLVRVLYNCPKCAIHFSEDNYLTHYSQCGKEIPSSTYCKKCDILINEIDFNAHDHGHKNDKLNPEDFTVVDAKFILYENTKVGRPVGDWLLDCNENSKTQSIVDKSTFLMMFCKLCGCFLSNLGIKRKSHVEGRCVNVQKHICKECGLVLTNKYIQTHRVLHKKIKNIKIQNYFFYDVQSKKQICPPIPKYPSCKVCNIHFLTRNEIISHECTKINFEVCEVCQIKFTVTAFKLHMQFHQYSIENAKEPTESVTRSPAIVDHQPVIDITADLSPGCNRSDLLLYTCKSCLVTFDSYDNVVKHCQSYYDSTVSDIIVRKCQQCNLNINELDYKTHNEIHKSVAYDSKYVKILNFDPMYMRFGNDFWIKHIFGSLSNDNISRTIEESIYKLECRIKMEVHQSGVKDPTFYECCKCNAFVNPIGLFKHAENMSCISLQKYDCSHCEKVFVSMDYKMCHEKDHNINNSHLCHRWVRFNMKKDIAYHKTMFESILKYVLYQCRNCKVIIEKYQRKDHKCHTEDLLGCVNCGLLLNKESYILHTTRHKELANFNFAHMTVVLFGGDLGLRKDKPSFHGVIMDYTFYKCKLCDLCVRTEIRTLRHKCVSKEYTHNCAKCNLCILRQEITSHSIFHVSNPEFTECTLNIILFNNSKDSQNDVDFKDETGAETHAIEKVNIVTTQKLANLFKCNCGLHFLVETTFRDHIDYCVPKMKIAKQYCTKCGLLFRPEELFNHLLTHHADKKLVYNFEIIDMSKIDDLTKAFKCVNCDIYFMKVDVYDAHIKNCGIKESVDIVDSESEFNKNNQQKESSKNYGTSHQISLQDANNKSVDTLITDYDRICATDYEITRENLEKLDLSNYSNVVYKCNPCNVCYLTESTWIRHLRTCNKQKYICVLDVCKICGLQFSLQSLTKHKYIHHEKFDLKKDEIIVKNSVVDNMEE